VYSCQWEAGAQSSVYRPTRVEISQKSFATNIRRIAGLLPRHTRMMAVVKANAYGHMAIPLSKIAVQAGAAMLGVSSVEEGAALRSAGITAPILILGSIYPLENFSAVEKYRLIPTISSFSGLHELDRRGRRTGKQLSFHLKIDTGMGRVGISPAAAPRLIDKISACAAVRMDGMYTHFTCADTDPSVTERQLALFTAVVSHARSLGLKFAAHAANSAAVFRCPAAHFDLVRPGISLYGIPPFSAAAQPVKLLPVLTWKTSIVFLKRMPKGNPVSYGETCTLRRPSLIATLPVGYADGYPRVVSNRAEVLVRGKRCRVVGRVTMDMLMVDVTGTGAAIGDEAVLIGTQGSAQITATELADHAQTIAYEITCGISSRVPRVLLP
jgi:alanine racemase